MLFRERKLSYKLGAGALVSMALSLLLGVISALFALLSGETQASEPVRTIATVLNAAAILALILSGLLFIISSIVYFRER